MKNQQTGIYQRGIVSGHIADVINRLVGIGIRIQILPEGDAVPFENLHQTVSRKVLGSVE